MSSKQIILFTTIVGSMLGSCIPLVWGDSFLSFSSIILTALGGIAGIYIGYKMTV